MVPILFSRSATLGSPAAALTLSSIPQNAAFLMFHVAARLATVTSADQWLGLRINGSSAANYHGNSSKGATGSLGTGIGGDGVNLTEWKMCDLTHAGRPAGIQTELLGMFPRYADSEFHTGVWFGHTNDGAAQGDFWRNLGGGYNDSVAAGITSLTLLAESSANLATGSKITVWGLGDDGTVTPVSIARSTQSGLALDFLGDEFKDFTAASGANNFTAANVTLGRTLQVKITGGDGTTTIGFPAGTEVLENNYSPGADAWLTIRCTDEVGPAFIATLKDVV